MSYHFPPYAPAYLINFLLTLAIAFVAWRRRRTPGALAFTGVMLCATVWSFAQFFESGADTLQGKVFWSQVQYLGGAFVSTFWFVFAVRYSGVHFAEGRRVMWLFVIPLITLGLAWTNPLHQLVWARIDLTPAALPVVAIYHHGFWFWIFATYSYVLVITGSVLLIREAIYAPRIRQYQAAALVAGALMPLMANLIYILGLSPFPGLDLTSFSFTLVGLLYLPAMYSLRVLDVTPVARGAVIEQMTDAVIVMDAHGRIADVNAAVQSLLDLPTDDWLGEPLTTALAAFPAIVALGADTKPAQAVISVPGHPDCFLDIRKTPFTDKRGQPVGALFLLRDITQMKRAEQQSFDLALEHERVRLLSRFIRDASHEFRTPLAVINTSLYLMDRAQDPAVQRAQRDKIAAQVNAVNGLLDEMLTMSRLDEHEPLSLSNVDLNGLIRATVDEERAAHSVYPSVTLALADPLPPVRGDEAQLRRVVENLLRNAAEYATPGSSIALVTHERGGYVVFALSDTGIGIDPTTQRRIFERFFRSDEAHTTPGLGLGLPMARAIVEAHGGRIEVSSALGQGTTFTVQLPAQPAAGADRVPLPARLAAPLHPQSSPAVEAP
jgi:signal transduction histidine kinase